MTKEELLKEIMKLPKVETDNPISTMNSINVDDLMSAVDRLNKVPDYNDLLKENQELKKQVETYEIEGYEQNEELNKMSFDIRKYKVQQKEFIDYLEDEKDRLARECSQIYEDSLGKTRLVSEDIFNEVNDILQKYRSIIGESDV